MAAQMMDLDDAWESFMDGDYNANSTKKSALQTTDAPKCSDIYISTKTKISYLNQNIDLHSLFWMIPVVHYHEPKCGIIKKQMKFNSASQEELDEVQKHIDNKVYTEQHILSRIVKNEGRVRFRDVRKISIGLCKKDITSYRCKKKGAFYNCFALILRINHEDQFKEIHVKVFNTGKLEIPGIQDDIVLSKTLRLLCEILGPYVDSEKKLTWFPNKNETVLINSNFSCGYFIDRDKLYQRLKYHYRINSAFDACSYPGIQCEFYYNTKSKMQNGQHPSSSLSAEEKAAYIKMSFMIFRTGSVLIVGKCNEDTLHEIYRFLKNMLEEEFHNVNSGVIIQDESDSSKKQVKKVRKKTIIIGS